MVFTKFSACGHEVDEGAIDFNLLYEDCRIKRVENHKEREQINVQGDCPNCAMQKGQEKLKREKVLLKESSRLLKDNRKKIGVFMRDDKYEREISQACEASANLHQPQQWEGQKEEIAKSASDYKKPKQYFSYAMHYRGCECTVQMGQIHLEQYPDDLESIVDERSGLCPHHAGKGSGSIPVHNPQAQVSPSIPSFPQEPTLDHADSESSPASSFGEGKGKGRATSRDPSSHMGLSESSTPARTAHRLVSGQSMSGHTALSHNQHPSYWMASQPVRARASRGGNEAGGVASLSTPGSGNRFRPEQASTLAYHGTAPSPEPESFDNRIHKYLQNLHIGQGAGGTPNTPPVGHDDEELRRSDVGISGSMASMSLNPRGGTGSLPNRRTDQNFSAPSDKSAGAFNAPGPFESDSKDSKEFESDDDDPSARRGRRRRRAR